MSDHGHGDGHGGGHGEEKKKGSNPEERRQDIGTAIVFIAIILMSMTSCSNIGRPTKISDYLIYLIIAGLGFALIGFKKK